MQVVAVICSLQKIYNTTDTVSEPCHKRQDLWPGGKAKECFKEALPSQKKCRAWLSSGQGKAREGLCEGCCSASTVDPPTRPLQLS